MATKGGGSQPENSEPTTPASADTVEFCPQCRGWGVIRSANGVSDCPDCQGRGLKAHLESYTLTAVLPPRVPYGQTAQSLLWLQFRPWIAIISLIFTVAIFVRIGFFSGSSGSAGYNQSSTASRTSQSSLSLETKTTTAGPSFLDRFHVSTGWFNLIFWILLLADLYFLSLRQMEQQPPHLLNDLRQTNPKKRRHLHFEEDGTVDIIPYFTRNALEAIDQAIIMTEKLNGSVLTPEIFLSSLLCSGKTALIVSRLERDPEATCKLILQKIKPPAKTENAVTLEPATRALITDAFREAYESGFNSVDVEDFLLIMTKNDGPLKKKLEDMDLPYAQIRTIAFWMNEELEAVRKWQFWRERGRTRPKGYMNRAWTARPTPFLDQYSRDFTHLAALGNLPVVKVRDQEIDAAIRALSAGEKNNVLLVGDPGVGKVSIVGAIAERMVEETVPEPLKDKRLVELNISALVSGGRAEKENMDQILQEVQGAGNVILFIGHIETLVNQQGGLSAAALLEAASTSGYLQIIGAATYTDYHRYIESNPTFANSFQKVEILEVNDDDAVTIIEEESPVIQSKYRVLLTYPAIKDAVALSRKLLPDQLLPEKAIDVLNDAAQLASSRKQLYVTQAIVQEVLSGRTHVPVTDMTTNERAKLISLGAEMKKRVIGQDEAVDRIAEALRRARTGLKDEKRPIGSFLFVGPTGVGKTETARTLAGTYFGNRDAMTRIDLSEYQDARAIYRLIGAPASSSAEFTEGGDLTKAVREKPYSIILLDEIEKAHPDVFNILLQIMDDGRLTENTGRVVPFANTIIIATSNAGASEISQLVQAHTDDATLSAKTQALLQAAFKPEFINRFDSVVIFKPLSQEHVQTIATIMLAEVAAKLKEQGIEAVFANDVVAYVAKIGFDPKFGARPLRRAIQDHVETKLADLLLAEKINKKEKLVVTAEMLGLA